jgi:hypothetical protein
MSDLSALIHSWLMLLSCFKFFLSIFVMFSVNGHNFHSVRNVWHGACYFRQCLQRPFVSVSSLHLCPSYHKSHIRINAITCSRHWVLTYIHKHENSHSNYRMYTHTLCCNLQILVSLESFHK